MSSIREENQDSGFGLEVFQPLSSNTDGRADGGPVSGHADLHFADQIQQEPLVHSKRGLCKGLLSENDHADPVRFSLSDEVADHLLDCCEPGHRLAVQLKIQGLHGTGSVQAEHYVHAWGPDVTGDIVELGPRGSQDQQNETTGSQDHRDPCEIPVTASGEQGHSGSHGICDAQWFSPQAEKDPRSHNCKQDKDDRVSKPEYHWFAFIEESVSLSVLGTGLVSRI